MEPFDRADLLMNLNPGGRYEGMVAIFRDNSSGDRLVFDHTLVGALPPGVRWIANNGAGYDQIDVNACKEKGTSLLPKNSDRGKRLTSLFSVL